ncbi:ribosome small subunit-dependent GTPase A [Vallitalea okinawensis]|uniref:ribosome small subunit-dependent GTPase A n=1 Tax=Vallitalea okinawensis TaxID=2078660 RepID=UPI000CFC4AF6|nr:ribosome small subunit-dependent GTPase A [Vallitalea okinawensis]
MQGKIIKGIAGFYYVDTKEKGIIECKARGVFRKKNITPLIGDEVEFEIGKNGKGYINEIFPRKNSLIRPTVANVDQAIIVFAAKKPDPNFSLLDRFLILAEEQGIDVVICFNKVELISQDQLKGLVDDYLKTGYKVIYTSVKKQIGEEVLREVLTDKTTVFAGPSGVGKSSMLNMVSKDLQLKTGEISEKIERGKHTTRHAELMPFEAGGYVVDTPGFSSLNLFHIPYEELKDYFPEFNEHEPYCKFKGCMHIHEPVCGVKDAVEDKEISKQRYKDYKLLYDELKDYQDRNRWR